MAAYTQKIQQLYVAYFNRPADAGGLEYWESIVTQLNGDISGVSAAFAQSAEYRAAYAGMTNAEIVNQVYLNLFGRPAEDGGKAYWSNFLDIKAITVDNVVTTVALGARGSDLVAYNAKVSAASAFTAVLQANPDPGGYAGMAGALAARDYISAVTDDASLKKAILPANLKDAIAFVKAASTPAATVNLTTGIDEIVPSSKNSLAGHDTFNANSSGSNQTINANDKIDGGAGKNTLNINSQTNAQLDIADNVTVKHMQTVNLTADSTVNLDAEEWVDTKNLIITSVGSASITVPSSANVKLDDTLGAGDITLNGGANISLNIKDTTGSGKIIIGDKISPTGDVTIISNVAATEANSNSTEVHATGNVNIKQSLNFGIHPYNYAGRVTVHGGNATNSVTVQNERFDRSHPVTITDMNSGKNEFGILKTITSIGVTDLIINNNALENLTLVGGTSTVIIKNEGRPNPSNTTLTMNLNNTRYSEFTDNNAYKNLIINLIYPSKIDQLNSNSISNLTIKGDGVFSTKNFIKLSNLEKIVIEGNARLDANLDLSKVSVIDMSATNALSAEINSITIDASKTSYIGGAAQDYITLLEGPLTKDISLGDGNDRLILNGMTFLPTKTYNGGKGIDTLYLTKSIVDLFNSRTDFSSMFTDFEQINFSKYYSAIIDFNHLGNMPRAGIKNCKDLTLNSFANEGTLAIDSRNDGINIKNDLFISGAKDSINIDILSPNYDTDTITPWFNGDERKNGVNTDFVETINIKTKNTFNESTGFPSGNLPPNFLSLSSNATTTVNVSGVEGLELKLSTPAVQTIDASELRGNFSFSTSETSDNLTIRGSKKGFNDIDLRGSFGSVSYQGGEGSDHIKVGSGSYILKLGNIFYNEVTFTAGNSLTKMTTISDANASPTSLNVLEQGTETFNRARVTLPASASLADYANAVVKKGFDASANAALGWFQWKGDTYLVESLHDGVSEPTFVDGVDLIVKLTGLHDLSRADFNNTETLTLA